MKQKTPSSKLGRLHLPKIKIIGVGGGGCSIVGEVAKIFARKPQKLFERIEFIGANVDWQALKTVPKKVKKFYFGEEITHGLGCGMNPELGEKAAETSSDQIKKELEKTDFCIFISSLGGGTGSGAMPVFAKIASEMNILTLGVFTLPFKFEGQKRMEIAKNSINKIKPFLNSIIIIPNQKIFGLIKEKTSLWRSFFLMNKILAQTFEGLVETIYRPGLINTDFADLKNILKQKGGIAFLGSAKGGGKNRTKNALKKLLENHFINFDFKNAHAFFCDIAGPKDLEMKEVEEVTKTIYYLNPRAKIIWGINSYPNKSKEIRITLLAISYPIKKTIQKKTKEKKEVISPKKIVSPKKEKEKKKRRISKEKKRKEKTPSLKVKRPIRRNGLDLHRIVKKAEEELIDEEKKWDIPTFLRKKLSPK